MTLIRAYCDESGKFKDHSVIAFCSVAATGYQSNTFQTEWHKLLRKHGLTHLTMKHALNHNRELSGKTIAKGASNRRTVLLEFVNCVKKNLGHICGMALDVEAFNAMSDAARKQLGKNPHFTVFAVVVMELLHGLKGDQVLSIICDDEEEVAIPMYKLYRKIQSSFPKAVDKLTSLSLANDTVYAEIQAADLCASLLRLEARRIYFQEEYDYQSLFKRLIADLAVPNAGLGIIVAGADYVNGLSKSLDNLHRKYGHLAVPPLVEK
jgi:hypothetical protein